MDSLQTALLTDGSLEVCCCCCCCSLATGAAASGLPRVAGSGKGPSIAHRLDSYFERMKASILLFGMQRRLTISRIVCIRSSRRRSESDGRPLTALAAGALA